MTTTNEDMVVAVARAIFDIGKAARDRGVLSMWTVFDHPADYPDGYMARRFEAGGGNPEPIATTDVITGDIALIRAAMERCGLFRMQRAPVDPPKIVETWM